MDAAVVKPHEYVEYSNEIDGHEPSEVGDLWKEAPGEDVTVLKHGARTGLTRGTLTPIAADHVMDQVGARYTNGWWVDADDDRFADEGDSGSIVVDEQHRLIGMVVAIKARGGPAEVFVHGAQQIFSALRIALR